ncbi:hypothetical protein [Subtercola boreus]|nr:hypothetical protein [Subtercola boreus]
MRSQTEALAKHHGLFDAIRAGSNRLAESIAFTHIEKRRAPSLAMLTGL